MKKNYILYVFWIGLALIVLAACGQAAVQASAAEPPLAPPAATAAPTATIPPTEAPTEAPPTLDGDPVRGGRLYDEWTKELAVDPPKDDQPLWASQTTNTRTGAVTWRCKECHGWDYKGLEGAYGAGSHKTGFPGLMAVSGKDPAEILDILNGATDPKHDFSKVMAKQDLTDLALFLSQYLKDDSAMIALDMSLKVGDAEAGKAVFNTNCKDCHGPQGTGINFGTPGEPEYQGTVAKENPWEFMHKVRFGQAGFAGMPSLVDDGLSDDDLANLLAYVATFPTSSPVSEAAILYDNWITGAGLKAPEKDNALFATQKTNTRTGANTWRCRECHGTDYRGIDGVYGVDLPTGSHKTGFPGIMGTSGLSVQQLTDLLNGKKNAKHNFVGEGMLTDELAMKLVLFIQTGLVNTDAFIQPDTKVIGGNLERGKELFESICAECHGKDGKLQNFHPDEPEPEYVGTAANANPWGVFHKISYGIYGQYMPAFRNLGWTTQDIIDVLMYSQTLPIK